MKGADESRGDWIRSLAGRKQISLIVYDLLSDYRCIRGDCCVSSETLLDEVATRLKWNKATYEMWKGNLKVVVRQFKEQWTEELEKSEQLRMIF